MFYIYLNTDFCKLQTKFKIYQNPSVMYIEVYKIHLIATFRSISLGLVNYVQMNDCALKLRKNILNNSTINKTLSLIRNQKLLLDNLPSCVTMIKLRLTNH